MLIALILLALLVLHNEHMHKKPISRVDQAIEDVMTLAERGTPRAHDAAELLKWEIAPGRCRVPTNALRDYCARAYSLPVIWQPFTFHKN